VYIWKFIYKEVYGKKEQFYVDCKNDKKMSMLEPSSRGICTDNGVGVRLGRDAPLFGCFHCMLSHLACVWFSII
jgi:hypothetical protein